MIAWQWTLAVAFNKISAKIQKNDKHEEEDSILFSALHKMLLCFLGICAQVTASNIRFFFISFAFISVFYFAFLHCFI